MLRIYLHRFYFYIKNALFNISLMKIRFFIFLIAFTYSLISGYETYAQYSRSITATKTYTSNGTFTITDITDVPGFDPTNEIFAVANVDILIVGGCGGGGRGNSAGGGGSGQVRVESIDLNIGASLYIQQIGSGGGGSSSGSSSGNNGLPTIVTLNSDSFSNSYTAAGGTGGANNGAGGSSGNGNLGGARNNPPNGGGGGGSQGGAGSPGTGNGANSIGGNGGNGINVSMTGNLYGAGGGGNGRGTPGLGGSNGLGGHASTSSTGLSGAPNTGSGGGAGVSSGGSGSNGIVVVQIVYRILPVEFLSFTAQYQSASKSGLLEWKTAKEWENSHFEIERAVNYVKTWETVGRVEGNGYSDIPVDYTYLDNNLPSSGGNMFYRLKQVDYSGSFSYSVTKAIKVPSLLGSVGAWNTYPNPSTRGTEVKVALIQPGLYQDQAIYITLSNLLGQTNSYSTSSPEEISSIVSDWLNSSYSGLYVLDITWGNQRQQIKLIRN